MRRKAALGLGAVGLVVMLAWSGWRLSNSRTHQIVGDLITRVETSDSIVALTFDDGPVPVYTDSVLALLSELQVPATFFMVGAAIERHPELAAEVVLRGHEIGNHSFSHRRLVMKAPSSIRREIEDTDSLIRAAGHEGPIFVRPPYGKRLLGLPLYLWRRDRPTVLWDVEPDTHYSAAADVVGYVTEHVRPGSIILLHVEMPARSQNRKALRRFVPLLKERGYRFVTLSELITASLASS